MISAFNDSDLDRWLSPLAGALRQGDTDTSPFMLRRNLAKFVDGWIQEEVVAGRQALVAVFGSVARAECARDIDLIVLTDSNVVDSHRYVRINSGHWIIDLNIVSLEWLKNAWRDIEWGYCLAESYVLGATGEALESAFRRRANEYWSPKGIELRRTGHITCIYTLTKGALLARDHHLILLERLLSHEAARAVANALIDGVGGRTFSHRSLIEEINHHPNLSEQLRQNLVKCLTPMVNHENGYVLLRQQISAILRSQDFNGLTGYNPGDTRQDRCNTLLNCVTGASCHAVESLLEFKGGDLWLPLVYADDAKQLGDSVSTNLSTSRTGKKIWTDSLMRAVSIPRCGNVAGARWADYQDGRLKLIANTGGCKTASCHFCALPAFGRSSESSRLKKTVKNALEKYQPRSLALYNDGNLLNPREVHREDLIETCSTIAQYKIEELIIESIPRFIYKETISNLREWTKVSNLWVAMGLQCIGNRRAIVDMGRPDIDSLFDQAIDYIHEAGGLVRLYLLWGFGGLSIQEEWRSLRASIQWACLRGVEKISICPYAAPSPEHLVETERDSLPVLQAFIDAEFYEFRSSIEILDYSLKSCA